MRKACNVHTKRMKMEEDEEMIQSSVEQRRLCIEESLKILIQKKQSLERSARLKMGENSRQKDDWTETEERTEKRLSQSFSFPF